MGSGEECFIRSFDKEHLQEQTYIRWIFGYYIQDNDVQNCQIQQLHPLQTSALSRFIPSGPVQRRGSYWLIQTLPESRSPLGPLVAGPLCGLSELFLWVPDPSPLEAHVLNLYLSLIPLSPPYPQGPKSSFHSLLGSQSASDDAMNGHKVQQRKNYRSPTAPTHQSHMELGHLHAIVFVGGRGQRDWGLARWSAVNGEGLAFGEGWPHAGALPCLPPLSSHQPWEALAAVLEPRLVSPGTVFIRAIRLPSSPHLIPQRGQQHPFQGLRALSKARRLLLSQIN